MPAFGYIQCSTVYFQKIVVIFSMVMVYAYMCDVGGGVGVWVWGIECNVTMTLRITNVICEQPLSKCLVYNLLFDLPFNTVN